MDEAIFQPPIVGHIMGWVYRIYPRKTNDFGSESSKGDHFFQKERIRLPEDDFLGAMFSIRGGVDVQAWNHPKLPPFSMGSPLQAPICAELSLQKASPYLTSCFLKVVCCWMSCEASPRFNCTQSTYPKKVYMGFSLNGGTPKTPQNDHF